MTLFRLPGRLSLHIGLVMSAILVGTLVAHTAWIEYRQHEVARQRTAEEGTILAHTVVAAVTEPFLANDQAGMDGALRRFATFPGVARITVLNNQGEPRVDLLRSMGNRPRPVADPSELRPPTGLQEQMVEGRTLIDHTMLIWHPLLEGEPRNPGWVRLEFDTDAAAAATRPWHDLRYAASAAVLLVAAGLFGVLAGPLQALRRAMEFAGRLGHKGERLPTIRGPMEIAQLYSALNQASGRLADSERSLRLAASVFDHTREGILITDADRRILQANAAFTEITGYPIDAVVGKKPSLLRSGLHDDAFYAAMWRTINVRGHWRGEIWNRRKNGEIYAEMLNIDAIHDDKGGISHYIGVFGDISDIKATERRLETMANYDRLTGLPNRGLLVDRLGQSIARAERSGIRLAVGFLDLDGFKPVNDTWGHEVGDHLLVQVAERLGNAVRAGDTVARIGGDEFVLLIDELKDSNEIPRTMERVLASIAKPYTVDGNAMSVTASIGVAVYPHDGNNPRVLLANADHAMYEAKAAGRNVYRTYRAAVG